MKAIAIKQPWLYWIERGWKTIETRIHDRFKGFPGERIALHASLAMDKNAFAIAKPFLTEDQMAETVSFFGAELIVKELKRREAYNHPNFGAITSTVFVREHRTLTDEDSAAALCRGLYGLFLEDVRILPVPVPWRGSVFAFHVPDELLKVL